MPSRTIPRNGRQLCAWSRALSTTSHNILWDVFRSVARCGENWRKSRRAAGAAPLHRPRSLCVCSQGEIQQRQTANPRAASPTDANTICPQLAGLRVIVATEGAGWGGIRRPPPLCFRQGVGRMCFPHGNVGEGGKSVVVPPSSKANATTAHASIADSDRKCAVACPVIVRMRLRGGFGGCRVTVSGPRQSPGPYRPVSARRRGCGRGWIARPVR